MPLTPISDVQEVIAAIQDVMLTVPGIRKAPDYAPETLEGFPFSAVYLLSGSWLVRGGYMEGDLVVVIEVHWPRKNLPSDLRQIMPFSYSVPKALLSPTNLNLGGRIAGFNGLGFTFGPLTWGVTDTIGFKFGFACKVLANTAS